MKRRINVVGQPRNFRKPKKPRKPVKAEVRSDKTQPAFGGLNVELTDALIQAEALKMAEGVALFRTIFGDDGIRELQEKGILDENEQVVAPPSLRRDE